MATYLPSHLRILKAQAPAAPLTQHIDDQASSPINTPKHAAGTQPTTPNTNLTPLPSNITGKSVASPASEGSVSLESSRWAPHTANSSNLKRLQVFTSDQQQVTIPQNSTSESSKKGSGTQDTLGLTINTSFAQTDPHSTPVDTNVSLAVSEGTQNGDRVKAKMSNGHTRPEPFTKKPSRWPTKEERKAMKAPNIYDDNDYANNGDWGTDYKIDWNTPDNLKDWNGDWLPAPVEWEGRRLCRRDNFTEEINKFIEGSACYYLKKFNLAEPTCIIDNKVEQFIGKENTDIAPPTWIEENIELQPLQVFWNALRQSALEPIDSEDLELEPFWKRFGQRPFQKPLEISTALIEPVDDENSKADPDDLRLYKKAKHDTARSIIAERERKARMSERERKRERDAERRARKANKEPKIEPMPNAHGPSANIYLRPTAIDIDVHQILSIYTHYVDNTCYVSELKAPDLQQMTRRLLDIQQLSFPLIVAIQGSGKKSKAKRKDQMLQAAEERIVGFAWADDVEGRNSALSFCCEVEVYIHPEYLTEGIGKNILDRMMFLLNPTHPFLDAVPWKADRDDPNLWTPGGKRVISAVRINVHYPSDERSRVVWTGTFLERFGFSKEADFGEAGLKLGNWTRMAVFQAKTGYQIDPKAVVRSTF